ncbi:MAG: tetratricopeptide repeat protein, partial [Candidatus Eremiobacteraeota bacterium]|nr:tetratricopeptide repeat protein [Candidatus Eremiobacteraeota bacterium]
MSVEAFLRTRWLPRCGVRAVSLGIAVAVLMTPLSSHAGPLREHVVQQILLDGRPVQSTAGVTVTRGGITERTLRRGERIRDGTRIDVPAHVVIVITSTGAKSTTTLEPGASVTFVSTGSGELLSSNGGRALFSVVPKTLDFFRVQSGEALTASVHGTAFSVETGAAVTFDCREGEVNITKMGYVLIGQRRLQTSLIDVISAAATPQVTYRPSINWTLAAFTNFAQAEAFYRARLGAALHAGDTGAVDAARINLANVLRLEGRYSDALKTYRQALGSYRHGNDRDGEARALEGIGIIRTYENRPDAADSFRDALRLFRSVGDVDGEAGALKDLGVLDTDRTHYRDALRYHEQSLTLYREIGDRAGEARELNNVGIVQRSLSEYGDALRSFRQALTIYRRLNDRDSEATLMAGIGLTQYYQGAYGDAVDSFRSAATIAAKLGDQFLVASAIAGIGMVDERQGRHAEALAS